MKRFRFGVLALLALVVSVGLIFAVKAVLAQGRPEVKKVNGHISPLMANITYPNGKSRKVMILALGYSTYDSHSFIGIGEGDAEVRVWIDTLKAIKDTTDKEALYVFKDGSERELKIHVSYSQFLIANPNGGQEELQVSKVKSVEFLDAPRKDKNGKAMFDEWRYSPWTGEKLTPRDEKPDEKEEKKGDPK